MKTCLIINIIILIIISFIINMSTAIRCYTTLDESRSLECGMATGCVKILKKGTDFDPITGKFVPEEKRAPTVELFKGCFLISTPDVCFTAKDELTYCWCSSNDLCNSTVKISSSSLLISILFMYLITR